MALLQLTEFYALVQQTQVEKVNAQYLSKKKPNWPHEEPEEGA